MVGLVARYLLIILSAISSIDVDFKDLLYSAIPQDSLSFIPFLLNIPAEHPPDTINDFND
jgi:hypothetical protein